MSTPGQTPPRDSSSTGGVDAHLPDIQTQARILGHVGQELMSLAPKVAGAGMHDDVVAAGVICPDLLPGVLAALAEAEVGPAGVVTRGSSLMVFGELTDAAVTTYESVDAASAEFFEQLQRLQEGSGSSDSEQPDPTQGEGDTENLLGPLAPLVLTTLSGESSSARDYESAVSGLISIGYYSGLQDSGSFELVAYEQDAGFAPIGGVGDIFRDDASQEPTGPGEAPAGALGPSQIRVVNVTNDGQTSLVVHVPDTQDEPPRTTNDPAAAASDLYAMAGQETAVQNLVVGAIQTAQQQFPDAAVMLAGHSHGGVVAAAIASDPELVRSLNISSLVTEGSAIGGIEVEPSVATLSIGHGQDGVPSLGGEAEADRSNWVSVTAPAESVDASADPSVRAWLRQNERFFGGAQRATFYEFAPTDRS